MNPARPKTIFAAALLACALLLAATAVASAFVLDPSFGTGGVTTLPAQKKWDGTSVSKAVERPGGGYIAAGAAIKDSYWENYWMVSAFTADGMLDRSFGVNGRVMLPTTFGSRFLRYTRADSIALAPNGKILVGTTVDVATDSDFSDYYDEYGDPECNCTASRAAFAIVRLNANGSIDRSFGRRGVTILRDVVRTWDEGLNAELGAVAVDKVGRTVAFGVSTDVRGDGGWDGRPYGLIYRLTRSGARDRSFGKRGRVVEANSGASFGTGAAGVGIDAAGAIRTATEVSVRSRKSDAASRWAVHKYSSNGVPDKTFGAGGIRRINPGRAYFGSAVMAGDGSVTFSGSLMGPPTDSSSDRPIALQSIVERVNPAGAMDASFGNAGVALLPVPAGSGEVWIEGMSPRADGGLDLAARHRPGAKPDEYNDAAFQTGLRSLSSTGQLIADSSGQTIMPLPELGNDYEFQIVTIFRHGDSVTLIGDRSSDLVKHENRITLMRVTP